MLDIVRNAIEARQVLEINYDPGPRTIEPHTLGYGKDGQVLLRAYQTEGASSSGEHKNWKLFRLDRATSLEVSGEAFNSPRPEYRQGDKAMRGGIIAEL